MLLGHTEPPSAKARCLSPSLAQAGSLTTRGKGQNRQASAVAAAAGCLFLLVLYRIRGRCPLNLSIAPHKASAHVCKGVCIDSAPVEGLFLWGGMSQSKATRGASPVNRRISLRKTPRGVSPLEGRWHEVPEGLTDRLVPRLG